MKKITKKDLNGVIGNKKKLIGICCAIILAISIISIGVSFSLKKDKALSPKEKLTNQLIYLGDNWYGKFYTAVKKEGQDNNLAKFKDSGIEIDLENLSRYELENENVEQIIQEYENNKCNMKESKVIVFPQEPYGEKDYKIKPVLECEF